MSTTLSFLFSCPPKDDVRFVLPSITQNEKEKRSDTVGTIPKSNEKIIEMSQIDTPNT
jgi:hypothetical protein